MLRLVLIGWCVAVTIGSSGQLHFVGNELLDQKQLSLNNNASPWNTFTHKPATFFNSWGITFGPVFSRFSKGWGKTSHFSETNLEKWFLAYPSSRIGFGTSLYGEHLISKRIHLRSEFNLLLQNQLAYYKKEYQTNQYRTENYYKYEVNTLQIQVPLLLGISLGKPEDIQFSLHAGPGVNAMLFSSSKGKSLSYTTLSGSDSTYASAISPSYEHKVTAYFGTFHYIIGAHFTINERPVRVELAGSNVLSNMLKHPPYSSRNWSIRVVIPLRSSF